MNQIARAPFRTRQWRIGEPVRVELRLADEPLKRSKYLIKNCIAPGSMEAGWFKSGCNSGLTGELLPQLLQVGYSRWVQSACCG